MQVEKDPITNVDTTGHEWDGIKELETPVPKPFVRALLISIIVACVMWVALPAWPYPKGISGPYFMDHTVGVLGSNDSSRVRDKLAALARTQSKFDKKITEVDLASHASDNKARDILFPAGAILYREHCAMCHGRNAAGQPHFPNLLDKQWLWSGEVDGVYETIKYGINAGHDDGQEALMPAFGTDETLNPDQISDVVEYVLSISKAEHLPIAAKRGATIFAEECSGCHNEGGVGGMENGAPNLTDTHSIYGSMRETINKSVFYGRAGVMPYWVDRLRDAEVRQLALYVKWLGADREAYLSTGTGDGDTPAEDKKVPGTDGKKE